MVWTMETLEEDWTKKQYRFLAALKPIPCFDDFSGNLEVLFVKIPQPLGHRQAVPTQEK